MQQASTTTDSSSAVQRGHIIVIGNEKGGSGKTTTSMHLIVGLLRLGFKVGSMDIDARQRSLTRYIENRKNTMAAESTTLPLPAHVVINRSPYGTTEEQETDERERFTRALARLLANCDFVVIDSPGSDTYLSRMAHSYADTVITPVNDSFVDLDVLASVDGISMKIQKPSIYSEMLWEQKMTRAKRDGGSIDLHHRHPGPETFFDPSELRRRGVSIGLGDGSAMIACPTDQFALLVVHDMFHDQHLRRGTFDLRHLLDARQLLIEDLVDWTALRRAFPSGARAIALGVYLRTLRSFFGDLGSEPNARGAVISMLHLRQLLRASNRSIRAADDVFWPLAHRLWVMLKPSGA